jgi:hypothetical protein
MISTRRFVAACVITTLGIVLLIMVISDYNGRARDVIGWVLVVVGVLVLLDSLSSRSSRN